MFDPADRRKQILYKAVAALARRERSRLGLYKKLSVVPTRLLLEEEFAEPFGAEIAGDAESIRTMRLSDAVRDPCVLSPIAVGVVHFQLRMRRL
jgi:hypothetical protein